MAKVQIYALGLVQCSVCAPEHLTEEGVEFCVNLQSPTGIESKWRVSKDKQFANGSPNPCPCEKDKKRLHYLLSC